MDCLFIADSLWRYKKPSWDTFILVLIWEDYSLLLEREREGEEKHLCEEEAWIGGLPHTPRRDHLRPDQDETAT